MGADEYAKLRLAMIAVFEALLGKSMQGAQVKGLLSFFFYGGFCSTMMALLSKKQALFLLLC